MALRTGSTAVLWTRVQAGQLHLHAGLQRRSRDGNGQRIRHAHETGDTVTYGVAGQNQGDLFEINSMRLFTLPSVSDSPLHESDHP